MRKTILSSIIIIIGLLCSITACAQGPKSSTDNACIPPLTEFAYYAGQGTPYLEKPTAPPDPWIVEATIDLKHPGLLGVRTLPNNVNELWFFEAGLAGWERNSLNQVYIFRTDDSQLKPIALDDMFSDSYFPVEDIFITPDNSVWAAIWTFRDSYHPILWKYDETTNKIFPATKLIEIEHHSSRQTIVLLDQQTGMFWFLVPYGHIYSYDPASDTLEKHISIEEKEPGGAVITPDGKIYIYTINYELSKYGAADALFLYSPKEESIEPVSFYLEAIGYPISLFIDHSERLWMNSHGWREPDGTWYQLVRSPLFILAAAEPSDDRIYHWNPPIVKFEAPENVLWFTGRGGTYSLDVEKGQWCWVSTFSNLEQDPNGNLWLMADGKLYKFPLIP